VLDVQNIVICGHTSCGAIEAILEPERTRHLEFVSRWLGESATIPALLREKYSHLTGEERLVAATEENVLVQLENLRSYAFVSERLEAGRLKLAGWVFKIASAQVFGYDPILQQFVAFARAAT
jgi:carbonic anhydrase